MAIMATSDNIHSMSRVLTGNSKDTTCSCAILARPFWTFTLKKSVLRLILIQSVCYNHVGHWDTFRSKTLVLLLMKSPYSFFAREVLGERMQYRLHKPWPYMTEPQICTEEPGKSKRGYPSIASLPLVSTNTHILCHIDSSTSESHLPFSLFLKSTEASIFQVWPRMTGTMSASALLI